MKWWKEKLQQADKRPTGEFLNDKKFIKAKTFVNCFFMRILTSRWCRTGLLIACIAFLHTVVACCECDNYPLGGSIISKTTESSFYAIAKEEGTDKVVDHKYGHLYNSLLERLRGKSAVKLLEIGLGCGMTYGPGRSVNV